MLCAFHVDDKRTLMHKVASDAGPLSLCMLAATCSQCLEICSPRLKTLREAHEKSEHELSRRLGYFFMNEGDIRALTIPDSLPGHLRIMLGKWLRPKGRLARVTSVRCDSWTQLGDPRYGLDSTRWVDLTPVHEGQGTSSHILGPLWHSGLLDTVDTSDGLLKTVLQHGGRDVTSVNGWGCPRADHLHGGRR